MSNEDFSIINSFEEKTYRILVDNQEVLISNIEGIQRKLEEVLKEKKHEHLSKYGIYTKFIDNKVIIYGENSKTDGLEPLTIIQIQNCMF